MIFPENKKIGIIGSGSWATAIAKIITENGMCINWFIRKEKSIKDFKDLKHNSQYLTSVEFDLKKINFSSDINEVVDNSNILIFAIPSAFLRNVLDNLTSQLDNKLIISAAKGLILGENLTLSQFFHEKYDISEDNIVIVSGPCHAEEISLERLSYLTFASKNILFAKKISELFFNDYLLGSVSEDVIGIEYIAAIKNIYAIAAGMAHGARYGDNFHAVLISNSVKEIDNFLNVINPVSRNIYSSVYIGDLLVTAYSQFSRNRTFGYMIGKGYSVKSTVDEMLMVAEGYYAVKGIKEIKEKYNISMPIVDMVYRVVYDGVSLFTELEALTKKLN